MGHKKTNTNKVQHHIKNFEQQHRPLQKLGELRCFRKVSSSCFLYNTPHVVHHQRHVQCIQNTVIPIQMVLARKTHIFVLHIIILHNIFNISYTGHNQSKLVPFAGKCFFASSFNKRYLKIRSPPHYFCLQNPKNKNKIWCDLYIYIYNKN